MHLFHGSDGGNCLRQWQIQNVPVWKDFCTFSETKFQPKQNWLRMRHCVLCSQNCCVCMHVCAHWKLIQHNSDATSQQTIVCLRVSFVCVSIYVCELVCFFFFLDCVLFHCVYSLCRTEMPLARKQLPQDPF